MEEGLKILGAFASLFAIYKLVIDVVLARSNRRRDEYSFAKNFLSDLEAGNEHLYVLEKGFFALTGKVYSIPEIKVLLSQPSPSIAIDLRGDCGGFITFRQDNKIYTWKNKWINDFTKKHMSAALFILYIITASLAMIPIYIQGVSLYENFSVLIYSASLIVAAISCLIQQANFNNAKKFMATIVQDNSQQMAR